MCSFNVNTSLTQPQTKSIAKYRSKLLLQKDEIYILVLE